MVPVNDLFASLLGSSWPAVFINVLVILLLLALISYFLSELIGCLRLFQANFKFIEIIPGNELSEAARAEQLFSVLHSLSSQASLKDRILRPSLPFSLEVASKAGSVRFIVRLQAELEAGFKRALLAF